MGDASIDTGSSEESAGLGPVQVREACCWSTGIEPVSLVSSQVLAIELFVSFQRVGYGSESPPSHLFCRRFGVVNRASARCGGACRSSLGGVEFL